MKEIRLAIAPINWSNDDMPELGGEIPLEQCLSEMQEAGFAGTEIGHKFPDSGKAIKALLRVYNLELASAWHSTYFLSESFTKEHKRLEERLTILADAGAKHINFCECSGTVHGDITRPLRQRPHMQEGDWVRFSQSIHQAAAICEKYGITITYHHHMGTVIQNEHEILQLLSVTEPEQVSLCFDTGHLRFGGTDPLRLWPRVANRVRHIHLKDVRTEVLTRMGEENSFLNCVKQGIFTVPGDGAIDFAPLLQQIVASHYTGWMVVEAEQDPAKANPLAYARKAYTYLDGILNLTQQKKRYA